MIVSAKTCPLTGGSFTAILEPGQMTVTNPLTGELVIYEVAEGMVTLPLELFAHIPTMRPSEAAKALDVSMQRISQLSSSGKLPPHYVCGELRFMEADVVRYKEQRKNGRPHKE